MKKTLLLLFVFITQLILAQCPTISCVSALSLTNCTSGQTIAATSNYSANITSRWIGPGGLPLASSGTDSSIVNINHIGTYTVEFKDNFSNCVVQKTVNVIDMVFKPTFDFVSSAFTKCVGTNIHAQFNSSTVTSTPWPMGIVVSYTLLGPWSYSLNPTGILSNVSNYTISTCGMIVPVLMDNFNTCRSSFSITINCSTATPTPFTITGSNTVCLGSSVNFTANGTNHTWNGSINTPTFSNIPTASLTNVALSGFDINGCTIQTVIPVYRDNTCSDVWPGDANSDGLVNNLDVFEIGLAFSNTGPSRTPGGNAYLAQFANNWLGTVSSGKNKAHADCNGDGIVDNADTMAIHANYNLSHSFKNSESVSTDPDLSFQSFPNVVNEGMWNKTDIVLGDSFNVASSVYGIAFDLNYDQSFIEPDSVFIRYIPSFLNNSNQNVEFRKAAFNNGKLYAASVRTDGSDIFGYGKIAEFWFKLKSGIPVNSAFNASVSNVSKINKSSVNTLLTGGSTALQVVSNLTGIEESSLQNKVFFFPNPASDHLIFQSSVNELVHYTLYDLLGREVLRGEFLNSKTIDVSSFAKGAYFIRLESDQLQVTKKLVID